MGVWLLFVVTLLGPGAIEVRVAGRFDGPDDCKRAALAAMAAVDVFAVCERGREA